MTAGSVGGRRPSVVAVHPHADLYGSDRMFLETVLAVGPDVTVVVPRAGALTEALAEAGVPVLRRPFPVLRKVDLQSPVQALRLLCAIVVSTVSGAWWLRRRGVRTLYVSTVAAPEWLVAGRLAGARVVCHVHESEPQLGRLASRVLLAPLGAANSIIANSTDCLQWIKASVGRRTARRTTVVHNGVREPQGDVVPAPEAGTTHLVVVGRLATRKGQDLAIRAAAVVVQAGHDVHLTLVGDSYPGYEDVSEGYRALAVELGLEQRVSFVGFTDPHPYVRAADVVLVPSRVEPFGLVAVEGMLHGRPVVAAAVGGLPEIIDDGRTGLLVRPEDPSALASAILRLLDDPGAARRLATAGQADARARFSIDSYAASIRELVAAH